MTDIAPPGGILYKYLTAPSAIATFTNRTIRWSSPILFNDPFDTYHCLEFGFPVEEMTPVLARRLVAAVGSDEELPAAATPSLRPLVESGRAKRRSGTLRYLNETALAFAEAGVENSRCMLHEIRSRWERWLRNMRILCVSEVPDDLLMWSHYADQHGGVVVGLRHVDHPEATLDQAMPVTYQPKIPVVAETPEEWADQLFGTKILDMSRFFDRLVLTKSPHWSYEREWRCVAGDPDDLERPEMVSYWPLRDGEIAAVYLGCRILGENRARILRAIERFPDVDVYQARRTPGEFSLTFDRVEVERATGAHRTR